MIARPRRQLDDRDASSLDALLTRHIREAHDCVRIGDVEVLTDQRHAER